MEDINNSSNSNTSSNIINNNIDNTHKNIQNINNIIKTSSNSDNSGEDNNSSDTSNSDKCTGDDTKPCQRSPDNDSNNNNNSPSSISNENTVKDTNTNLQNINTIILSGIESAKNLQNGISQGTSENQTAQSSDTSISDSIDKASSTLQNINNIKEQLAKLDLNPRESLYFDNCINPLLTVLNQLSSTSVNLATSSYYLSTSIITHGKESKLKDTIHLVYDINKECEDVYDVLEKRIDTLLELAKKCSCLDHF
ncbi:hypothetical protein P8V03_12730 [Clostridium sp. A1-XYC3]|uniref:Uncharacterized protein n=1 Tax=Clostridium tanneri TaxID=3037988 RepID=A0ABU4JV49_9CLOT|nr:hypothetical protein [Clostridium sp. A1-XYC3]MDW8802015.1 hypothetical protein [Clostridium sp. A1-XYC3]